MVRGQPIYVKTNIATFSMVMKVEDGWHDVLFSYTVV